MGEVVGQNRGYYHYGVKANNERVVYIQSIALVGPSTTIKWRGSDCDSAEEYENEQSPLKRLIILIRTAIN